MLCDSTFSKTSYWTLQGLGFAILALSAIGCRKKRDDCDEYVRRLEKMECAEKRSYGNISYNMEFVLTIIYDGFCTDKTGREVTSDQLNIREYAAECILTRANDENYYVHDGHFSDVPVPKECAGTIDDSPYSFSGAYLDESNAFNMIIKETGVEAPIDTFDMPCGELKVSNTYE